MISRLCVRLFVTSLVWTDAYSQAALDPTFGKDDGFFGYPIGPASTTPYSIISDSAGRIFTAGQSETALGDNVAIVTRHYLNGTLDTDFGSNGVSKLFGEFPSASNVVAIDHQDRVLIGGDFYYPLIGCDKSLYEGYFSVTRLHALGDPSDGQPDENFGSSVFRGTVALHPGDCNSTATVAGLAVDANDSVIATGSIKDVSTFRSYVDVAKWTASGDPDGTFGLGGIVTMTYPSADSVAAVGIAIDTSERILIAAEANNGTGSPFAVARLLVNGSIDSSYGDSGYATITLDGNSHLCCISVDKFDRTFVAGDASISGDSGYKLFVARFDKSGILDKSFGTNGFSWIDLSDSFESLGALVVDQAGRVIATGSSVVDGIERITTIHLNIDGSLNKSIGFNGVYKNQFGLNDSYGTGVTLDRLNRPVVTGFGYDRDGRVPVLIRYDEMFGDGFD